MDSNSSTDIMVQLQIFHSELQELTECILLGDSHSSKMIHQSELNESSRLKLDARMKLYVRYIIGYPVNLRPQDNKYESPFICPRCQALVMGTGTAASPIQMSTLQYLLQISLHICKLCCVFLQKWGKICMNQIWYAPVINSFVGIPWDTLPYIWNIVEQQQLFVFIFV